MNKSNEPGNHPVDDLFARKLGKATLPTNADGFARLQARLGQPQAGRKPGFMVWRNPDTQRTLAIAACLLLVCLFGWLYLLNSPTERAPGPQMATTNAGNRRAATAHVPAVPQAKVANAPTARQTNALNATPENQPVESVAAVAPKSRTQGKAGGTSARENANAVAPAPGTALARNKPRRTEPLTPKKADDQPLVSPAPDQVAVTEPVPVGRVLVVTIAEPERLVAARQAVKMDEMETALAAASKSEKAARPGFWEQVRRVKEGEAFARSGGSNDERSLLNRAFSGLKNSIEKDKTARQ